MCCIGVEEDIIFCSAEVVFDGMEGSIMSLMMGALEYDARKVSTGRCCLRDVVLTSSI